MPFRYLPDDASRGRALFVCPRLDAGGAESHWASLLPALAERGLGVRVLAIGQGGRTLEGLRARGVPVRELGLRGPQAAARLNRVLSERHGQPRVVVSLAYNAHAIAALFARATGTPHVLNWHRQPGLKGTKVQRAAVHLAARLGAGAIAVSPSQCADLVAYGMAASRIRVVPNGVAPPVSDGDRAAARAALGVPQDAFVPVLVARLRPEKRIGDFLQAVTALKRAAPEVPVEGVVVGDGPMEDELRRRAAELGAPVRFAGFATDPTPWYVASDVSCLTSAFEALPMTLIEAMACGRPVVATDVGGVRDLVGDGDGACGEVVGPGDLSGYAAALERLARDRERTAAMGRRAREAWEREYSFDGMADRYLELLTSVAGPPTRWPAA